MNLFASSNHVSLGQAFQDAFAREILLSQRLRASVLIGLFTAGLLVLWSGLVVFEALFVDGLFAGPVVPFSILMILFQVGIRKYTAWAIKKERVVPSWVWYVSAAVEISLVTMMFLLLRFNYDSPTYVLSAPAILMYALFITLSTLRLDGKFALFVGGLVALQYLFVSVVVYGSVSEMSVFDPTYETLFICFVRASILMMCGVGAAFVARELRLRMQNSYRVIEERNRVEAANQAKSTFLANVSHEIRTPLNAILGYTQLMASDHALSEEQRRSLQNISTSGGHLTDLINRVLDLSKIEAGREELQTEDFDLAELTRELEVMFELRSKQKGLAWAVDLDFDGLRVHGDGGKLRQVLVNLLGNAVKFADAGQVILKIETRPEDHFYFEVFDTGPGIPAERQAVIFDAFQQVSNEQQEVGTGLGLTIAHAYVEMMGGQLEVVSVPDKETRFFFTLHLPPGSEAFTSDLDVALAAHLSPEYQVNALVVDDIAQNRDILVQILERAGIDVREAESGQQALEMVAESVPDIVFMDILMPGLSGEETMKQLKEIYGSDQFVIVAVSAAVLEHQRKAYLEAGFDGFIDKPVQMKRVYSTVAQFLDVAFVDDAKGRLREDMDLSAVVLPESLFDALEKAAATHNLTRFNTFLAEAEALGEAEKQLVAPLRKMSQQYDLKSALEALKEIKHD